MSKFYMKPELMGGKKFYMIYKKGFVWDSFFERWNSLETSIIRLVELNGGDPWLN